MSKNTFIFLPNSLGTTKAGYLNGVYKEYEDCDAYYVTSNQVWDYHKSNIGYVGKKSLSNKGTNKIMINSSTKKVSITDKPNQNTLLQIIYDYNSFKNTDVIFEDVEAYGKHFKTLTEEWKKTSNNYDKKSIFKVILLFMALSLNFLLNILGYIRPLIVCSEIYVHFEENIRNFKWFFNSLVHEKFTPTVGNAFFAKILDILCGLLFLIWFINHEEDVLYFINIAIKEIIGNLKGLLQYLMGVPIGLKLNHSLNMSLARFFFYHISLWKMFLLGTQPFFPIIFKLMVLPGALGFSFQLAMLSDVISLGTFHVYSIYVYAARLFNLQIKGLASLWRLFIGRKYNPLRQRVDSCQYSADQLFIGTLGFTVLLFLLPTTTMYYAVFSSFRLVIFTISGFLSKLRCFLNSLPIYVFFLWVFNSPSVAGTLYLNWTNASENAQPKIEAKLNALPLGQSLKKFVLHLEKPTESRSLGCIFHCLLTGILI